MKIFPTQLLSRSSSPEEKNNTKHRAVTKIPHKSVSGCHPEKKKEMCEDIFTTKRGTKWPSNSGWSKCGKRNRIHRLKQSSWHMKGKYCTMRRLIQKLFPLEVNKGKILGNEPTRNCLADLSTTKTSSSS